MCDSYEIYIIILILLILLFYINVIHNLKNKQNIEKNSATGSYGVLTNKQSYINLQQDQTPLQDTETSFYSRYLKL